MKKNFYLVCRKSGSTYRVGFLLVLIFALAVTHVCAQVITTVAGDGVVAYTGDGVPATAAGLIWPEDVTVDGSGNMYIADFTGSRIRKVNAAGIISTFAGTGSPGVSIDGSPASASTIAQPAGLAVDGTGNIYIADFGAHRVYKVNTAGIISTFAGNGTSGTGGDGGLATAAQFIHPWGVAADGAGNVYIADEYGQHIRKVNASGIISNFAGTGVAGFSGEGTAATTAQINNPINIAIDAGGNVYFSDYGNNRIRMVNSAGIIKTVAGTGGFGFSGDGTPATAATLRDPAGLGTDLAGNLYISDYLNYRIRKVNAAGIISTIAGTGTPAFGGDGGLALTATFSSVLGIHVDAAQNIFLADAGDHRIRKITGHDRPPSFTGGHRQFLNVCQNTVGDSINSLLAAFDSDAYQLETWSLVTGPLHGVVNAATTMVSTGAAMTPAGTFYSPTAGYTGLDSFKVRVTDGILSDTTIIRVTINTIPSSITGTTTVGVGSFTTLSSAPPGGTWSSSAASIATITSGGVAVGVASGTSVITYMSSLGCIATTTLNVTANAGNTITTIAGNGTAALFGDNGPATAAELNYPFGIVTDGAGNKYFADEQNNRIRKVDASGVITTVAGSTGGFFGDGGVATAAKLASPQDVAVDAAGNLYIADLGNNRIRKVNTSGIISTVVGTGASLYNGEGIQATAANIGTPLSVTIDGSGNMYIADWDNERIRKVNTSGIITTIAGNGTAGFTGDGTPATAAEINTPQQVKTDGSGNVYIVDSYNGRIRMVNGAGIINTIAGGGSILGDGSPATTAYLPQTSGIAIDGTGQILLTDALHHRIRRINGSGIISTVAGNGTLGYSGDNCAATAAEIWTPYSVAVDGSGTIYFTDESEQRIRKISGNHAPSFIAGDVQSFSVCQNSVDSINSILAITDADNAQGETWGIVTNALHGTLVASYTAISNGGTLTPVGLSYTPNIGYNGMDSFVVSVTDCSNAADTMKVIVTVTPPPTVISGTATVCAGLTTTLFDAGGAGTWSSNNTSVATVTLGPAGTTIVTGVSAGTAIITFIPGAGCVVTKPVTVNPSPSAITGITHICRGTTTLLTDTTSGGTWSSSAGGIAPVSPGGMVTGSSAGVATISYTRSGCPALSTVTVNINPVAISGASSVCIGASLLYSDGIAGGKWSSANVSIATIDSVSGLLTGTGISSTFIYYTLPTGCSVSKLINVLSLPAPITGTTAVCASSTTTLADTSSGGYWTVLGSAPGVTVDSFTGIVSGVFPGTATILYTAGTCSSSTTVTVNSAPSPISGPSSTCASGSAVYSDATTGGTWSSSNSSVVSIDPSSGISVTGLMGTATISYTALGCSTTLTVTVNAPPPAIMGSLSACVGFTTILTDSVTGGTWMSGNTSVATVASTTGVVTGAAVGTARITYTTPSGCTTSATVTVTTAPGAITGTRHVCIGATTLLGNTAGGGTWSSSNAAAATVGSISGTVGGVSVAPVTITYTLGVGCAVTASVTVNPLPDTITGTASVCVGLTTTLGDPSGGGSWSNSGTLTNIGSTTGVVTGVASGYSPVTYTLSTGCFVTRMVTVNAPPSIPGGVLSVCPGATTSLSSFPTGGTWTSASMAIATVVPGSGLVTGIAPGTSLIVYTAVTGCSNIATVTVNALPSLFTVGGGGSYCAGGVGLPITLAGSVSGVTYQLFNGPVPVGSPMPGTGSALTFGTFTTAGTYTVFATTRVTGCGQWMTGSATITINPLPTPISGPSTVCIGSAITQTDTSIGGTWSSGTLPVATVTPGPSGGGVVSGVAAGSSIITYTLPTGCFITDTVHVSLSPVSVTGATTLCTGVTTALTDTVGGGTWVSSNLAVATVGSLSGVVYGLSSGTTTITYSLGSGCTKTKNITVYTSPDSIRGGSSVCSGSTITLSDATGSGTWSSSATAKATVTSAGVVTGVASGVVTISYTVGSGCTATTLVTVNTTPTAISGPAILCVGSPTSFTDGIGGGTWTTSSSSIATVGSGGTVTGSGSGIITITYSLSAGCLATKTVTVNAISAISGALGVCAGLTTSLSDIPTGGTWSSSSTSIATVEPASGIVHAIAAGTSVITYTTADGCTATARVTVNLAPSAITGSTHVCEGSATTLGNASGGGTWTSSNTSIATILLGTGVLNGVVPGTSLITYSLGGTCTTTTTVTVDTLAAPVIGEGNVCTGSTTTLSDVSGGGTWHSGAVAIATVTSGGVVTGVTTGIAVITYTPSTGCAATKNVTVYAVPTGISGTASVCVAQTTALSDATTGGTWSSSDATIATVGTGGTVHGVAAGTASILYVMGSGCATSLPVTVNAAPAAITGGLAVCVGTSSILHDATGSGIWTSGATAIATITGSGTITGAALGTATISYTVAGCTVTNVVSVNSFPGAISGPGIVCQGSAIALSDTPGGGSWSSGSPGVAVAGPGSGIVTGVSGGTANIIYSFGPGCAVSKTIIVNPLPFAITGMGTSNICVGGTTPLYDVTPSGVWGSAEPAIATINSSGIVSGLTGGIVTISYTISSGCASTTTLNVIAVPAITGGDRRLCAYGDTVQLYDSLAGGFWTSSLATISSSGVLLGFASGTAVVTYTVIAGCFVTRAFTVYPLPGAIIGTSNLCVGTTTTLSDTTSGGTWSTGSPGIAGITSGGSVTALSPGTTTISYTSPTDGCKTTLPVTVYSHPSPITGSANICDGSAITLSDTAAGGIWSSGSSGIATVGSATGIVSGVSAGTATISYYLAAGCSTSKVVTVNPLPIDFTITGGGNYCAGTSGVHIGLSGSQSGTDYHLYDGATSVTTTTGTGSAVDFGLETPAGTYKVTAINTSTTCSKNMPDSVTVSITPSVVPGITIAADPGTRVCQGTPVTLTATATNGGSSPVYQWSVNGIATGSTGASYSYTPVNNDIVSALLSSNATCAIPDTAGSSITIVVDSPIVPDVSITAAPGTTIAFGQSITFTATVTNTPSPNFIWYINGSVIPGFVSSTLTRSFTQNDTIGCKVIGGGLCFTPGYDQLVVTIINVGVGSLPQSGGIVITPNPNKGEFSVKGSLGVPPNEDVSIEITDMLGQVVYKNEVEAKGGKLNELIKLNAANGMYLLNISYSGGNKVFHIVVEQ